MEKAAEGEKPPMPSGARGDAALSSLSVFAPLLSPPPPFLSPLPYCINPPSLPPLPAFGRSTMTAGMGLWWTTGHGGRCGCLSSLFSRGDGSCRLGFEKLAFLVEGMAVVKQRGRASPSGELHVVHVVVYPLLYVARSMIPLYPPRRACKLGPPALHLSHPSSFSAPCPLLPRKPA